MPLNRRQQIEEYLNRVRESEEYKYPRLKDEVDKNEERLLELAEKEDAGDDSVLEDMEEILQNIDKVLTVVNKRVVAALKKEKEIIRLSPSKKQELTPEQSELLQKLEADYPIMRAVLDRYEISTEGMPTWDQVENGLTPEVLNLALKLTEPALLLVPPTTRESKVEAINKHPAKGQKHDTSTYKLEDNDLWNGGKAETENKWRVAVVEGVQNVAQDKQIYDGKRKNYEMIKLWVKKYEDQGLDVMNDADAYLTLMMKALVEDKPIDPVTCTVLNDKNLTKPSLVAYGLWLSGQVTLGNASPVHAHDNLRLRGSVRVDVQNFSYESAAGKEHTLTLEQKDKLISLLEARFNAINNRHPDTVWGLWGDIRARLETMPQKLWSLNEMERTGGEPDVVGLDDTTGEFIFMDCSVESPEGRRNCVYDREAEEEVKKKGEICNGNAVDMAATMGIELLTEEQYRSLQGLGEFDLNTCSWLNAPSDDRKRGHAPYGGRGGASVAVGVTVREVYLHFDAAAFRGSLRV